MSEAEKQEALKADFQTDTNGGSYIDGNVSTSGGNFVGRDKIVQGDEVNQYFWQPQQNRIPSPPAPEKPPKITDFVGREMELASYSELLKSSGVAIITGMPGVGKTILASVLAQSIAPQGNLFWHAFHKEEDASVIVWKLAGFLALHGQGEIWKILQTAQQNGGQLPPLETLIDYLVQHVANYDYVICLDDFQFVDTNPIVSNFVEQLLRTATDNSLRVICISRQIPNFMQIEELNHLEGIDLATTQILLAKLLPSLSVELIPTLHANTEGNTQLLILAIAALRHDRNPKQLIEHLAEVSNIERYLLNEVDTRLGQDERKLMNAVAVLLGYRGTRRTIEAIIDGNMNIKPILRTLSDRYLLVVSDDEPERRYSQHAIVQAFYYDNMEESQRRSLHQRAGNYYYLESDFIQAASHWYRAGNYERATTVLYDNFRSIVKLGKSQALYDLQARFPKNELDVTTWAKLKIVAGRAAMIVKDIPTALAELGEALNSPEIYYKAEAIYYRAKVFEKDTYKESLSYYERGIEILEGSDLDTNSIGLLTDMYIGKAWLYIDESEDLDRAQKNLSRAGELIADTDFSRQCDLHNAWAKLYIKQKNTEKGLDYLDQALKAAQETQNSELIWKTAHNLGDAYIWSEQILMGLGYLQQARDLASEIGNRQGVGKCYQTIGAAYFLQAEYESCIRHYKLAYDVYTETANRNWLGWVCCDLLEVYAQIGDHPQAQDYFQQAMTIAQELGAADLHDALTRLSGQYLNGLGGK